MTFNEKYSKIKYLASDELKKIEENITSSIHTREPLKSHIVQFLTAPSKRIRPVLAILYTKALGQNLNTQQLELLTAIELVHNASLIHDDIIDESDLRRGQKTISAEFGNKLGVISGDYILSIAMEKIANLNSIDILKKFSITLNKMCQGEINQNFDRFKIGTIEDYIEKSKNKTAYLFETAMTSCAMLSQASGDISKINDFAMNVGIAFQIRDDLINFTKTDSSKPSENDLSEGIYTAPIIYSQNTKNYTKGIEKTKSLLNNYIEKAAKQLENLQDNEFTAALKNFLELLKNE